MHLHAALLITSMFSSVLSQRRAQQASSPVFENREGEKFTSKWQGVLMGARDRDRAVPSEGSRFGE